MQGGAVSHRCPVSEETGYHGAPHSLTVPLRSCHPKEVLVVDTKVHFIHTPLPVINSFMICCTLLFLTICLSSLFIPTLIPLVPFLSSLISARRALESAGSGINSNMQCNFCKVERFPPSARLIKSCQAIGLMPCCCRPGLRRNPGEQRYTTTVGALSALLGFTVLSTSTPGKLFQHHRLSTAPFGSLCENVARKKKCG